MTAPVIEADDVSRSFGKSGTEVLAVHHVSFRVSDGELLLLMGPSGSGKTTLLAMLGCILRPTSGHIRVQGKEVGTLPSKELARLRAETIGFVFQGFNLLSALTAWENVALAGDLLPRRPRNMHSRSVEILKNIGLGHRLYHLPENLSAGEKQRVAFARALVNSPRIILADEPTANLDSENRDMVASLLRQAVKEQGVSVIIATHDERILQAADRVIRIEDGQLTDDRKHLP
ncbi:MAG TPA: ABC transporter ATP-binding protein [Syntrophales bacterium]|nr:ABC transporter ATP-binding protein [Syntrophales bacterium]